MRAAAFKESWQNPEIRALVRRCHHEVFGDFSRRLKFNPGRRICATEDCKNKLSGYNTGTLCWACQEKDEI